MVRIAVWGHTGRRDELVVVSHRRVVDEGVCDHGGDNAATFQCYDLLFTKDSLSEGCRRRRENNQDLVDSMHGAARAFLLCTDVLALLGM